MIREHLEVLPDLSACSRLGIFGSEIGRMARLGRAAGERKVLLSEGHLSS